MITAEWLAHVPGCEHGDPPQQVMPMASGTAHVLWRVRTAAGQFVLRAPAPGAAQMGLRDFARECQLQRLAALRGIAPAIRYCDNHGGLLVMDYVEGQDWRNSDFAVASRVTLLCERLRQLHDLTAPASASLDPVVNAERYALDVLNAGACDAVQIRERLGRARDVWQWCRAAERPSSPIHCDVHAGNLRDRRGLDGVDSLVLLDWEYAQVGDPLLDFAALCAYHPAAHRHVARWLRSGTLPGSALMVAQLPPLAAVFSLLGWLWYRAAAVQQPLSAADLRQAAALEAYIDAGLEVRSSASP